jgi:4-aminobutyrate aminotransferase
MNMTGDRDVLYRASQVFTPALHVYYPLEVARGDGVSVYGTDGKMYLDFSSGLAVLNIGHNHPQVVQAVQEQLTQVIHCGGVYYHKTPVIAAERLVSITPHGLDKLFFGNSGAEAVEAALKLARFVTGRQGIISFTGAFHGRTFGALSVTTSTVAYRRRYHPLLPSVYQVPYPYCYRCPFRQTPEHCGLCCLGNLHETLRHRIPADEVAALIIEPFLGEGGYFPAPGVFLQALRQLCDQHGILLIFDEVQSGVGRTGRWFAAEHADVIPDILTVAKGIASGFPLSAVVGRRELMDQWPSGAHGTTFGGNPVSCAAAIATLAVIEEQGLLMHVARYGKEIVDRLQRFVRDFPLVGQVRGLGFMIGIEFVTASGAPNGPACEKVLAYCLEQGLILIGCAPERHVIRFIPPLTATANQVATALDIFEAGIRSCHEA